MGSKAGLPASFAHGSSSGGGSRRSIQRVPFRSAISPYCGPDSDWKRQYFIRSSLRKGFFCFGAACAFVLVLVDGGYRVGVVLAGCGSRVAEGWSRDGLRGRDAGRCCVRSGLAAVDDVSGKVVFCVGRPGEVNRVLFRTGYGDESGGHRRRENVAGVQGHEGAGIASDFYFVSS